MRAFADAQEAETRASVRGSIGAFVAVRHMQTDVPCCPNKAHDRHRVTTVLDDVLQCGLCELRGFFVAVRPVDREDLKVRTTNEARGG